MANRPDEKPVGLSAMTPSIERKLRELFTKHRTELLERGRVEVVEYERRQFERGDVWVIGEMVVFRAQYEGYELIVHYGDDPTENMFLLGGGPIEQKE